MSDQKASLGDRLAGIARGVLLAAIGVVVALIVVAPRGSGNRMPEIMTRAQAEGISAAPGYIMMTAKTGGASKFFLCDTNNKVLCIYETNGEQLRLIGARKFDADATIFDGSLPAQGFPKGIDGNSAGVDRKTAAAYAQSIEAQKAAADKKGR